MWRFHDFVHAMLSYPTSRTARLGINSQSAAETWIFKDHTLITLKINPSNGHDYVDIWGACFYTNTPTNLRGSRRSEASEACDDPGNVSSCTAVQHRRRNTVYMSARRCLAQHIALIWVKRLLIRVSQSLGNATVSATHSASALLTQLLPVVMETLRLPTP